MSQSNFPTVSVVIPCKNRAHYLVPTIESVLQQDYQHVECIVVDGGSTDGTLDILKKYGDRIRWVSEPDNGHTDAINKGWHMSGGEILAWLNADDIYVVPDTISRIVHYMRLHHDVDVAYGNYVGIDRNGRVSSRVIIPREWNLEYAVKYCLPILPQPTSFIRRAVLERVGWLDEGDDHGLWLRIGLVGTIQHVPVHLTYVRRDPGLSYSQRIAEGKVRLTERFFAQPNLPHPFNKNTFRRRALSNACGISAILFWIGMKKYSESAKYVLKGVRIDPANIFYLVWSVSLYILFHYLPLPWQEKIRGRRWYGIQGIAGGAQKTNG